MARNRGGAEDPPPIGTRPRQVGSGGPGRCAYESLLAAPPRRRRCRSATASAAQRRPPAALVRPASKSAVIRPAAVLGTQPGPGQGRRAEGGSRRIIAADGPCQERGAGRPARVGRGSAQRNGALLESRGASDAGRSVRPRTLAGPPCRSYNAEGCQGGAAGTGPTDGVPETRRESGQGTAADIAWAPALNRAAGPPGRPGGPRGHPHLTGAGRAAAPEGGVWTAVAVCRCRPSRVRKFVGTTRFGVLEALGRQAPRWRAGKAWRGNAVSEARKPRGGCQTSRRHGGGIARAPALDRPPGRPGLGSPARRPNEA